MARLHIRRASIYIVSSVLSHPDSWRLAVDKSTHSLFSLLSSMRIFSNVIMMTSNVVRAEETRLAAAFVFSGISMGQTGVHTNTLRSH